MVTIIKEGTRENYLYILALLNSRFFTYYLTKISTPFRGGFYSCNKQYLSQLPIKLLDLSNPVEKSKHDELVFLADKMLKLNKELTNTSENTDKWYSLKKEIEQTDRLIDEMVYELYEITEEEEINIIKCEIYLKNTGFNEKFLGSFVIPTLEAEKYYHF